MLDLLRCPFFFLGFAVYGRSILPICSMFS